MTESEWLAATDPQAMLETLRESGKATDRKLRLFAVACCRRVWHLMTDDRSRRTVEVAEEYLDDRADTAAKSKAQRNAHQAAGELNLRLAQGGPERRRRHAETMAALAAAGVLQESGVSEYASPAQLAASQAASAAAVAVKFAARANGAPARPSAKSERLGQCLLLRCLFGSPFRPLRPLDPGWLTWNNGVIPILAQAIYEERSLPEGTLDPARLAVLADALEDAGCTEAELLAHLRGPGPHVRGCHAIDALLGRE
jgi:hypothetical protein